MYTNKKGLVNSIIKIRILNMFEHCDSNHQAEAVLRFVDVKTGYVLQPAIKQYRQI